MTNINTLILCLISISSLSFGQNKLKSDFKYKIIYNLSYSIDSTDLEDRKSEYMVLFIGNNLSTFSSRAKLISNRVIVNGNTASTSRESVTAFPYVILKDYQTNKMAYTLQIVDDSFFYEEKLKDFVWKIEEETKEIQGLKTQKATTNFAGRDYVAWFTNDIPVSDGPYKFNGLPGLIVEISDTDNHYSFELHSVENLKPTVPFRMNFKNYIKTDKEKLIQIRYKYRQDPFTYANNPNVKITPKTHKLYVKSFTEMLEKENNPLEKK